MAQCVKTREYVDGFGRSIQSQSQASGGGRAVTARYYEARGLVRRESLPFAVTGNGFSPVSVAWRGTTMSMDQATVYAFDVSGLST